MGKLYPKEKEKESFNHKNKRRLRVSTNRKEYVKPGALAHLLRYNRANTTKCCTDLGKKRVVVLDSKKEKTNESPPLLSPERTPLSPVAGPIDLPKQNIFLRTPKTPKVDSESESKLESLPMDLLVKILCHLHHDQLRAVFHVSRRIRRAVFLARQFHFNYTTPDRTRQEMLRTMTPLPTEHWPFLRAEDKGICLNSPHTPKAPRHGPRPPSRYKLDADMKQITAVLFKESAFPSAMPPCSPKSLCKLFVSNRALFGEDELCQAVAQNKLQ
ncbi:hypothetical protein Sjap_026492 [Stephania japonica]|uniref:F-box domain-containing protein n=1 Tax=Stephania japonica TaxID=461633 RepID=A0AAP0E3Q5_9MAGN